MKAKRREVKTPSNRSKGGGPQRLPRLMIVDDEPSLRLVMKHALTRSGYDVFDTGDPLEALEAHSKNRFDLIIQDIRMPGMDGLDLLRRIKDGDPDAIVIVMTAYGTWDTAVQAMRLGAFDYVEKPFDTDDMRTRIAELLARRELAAAVARDENPFADFMLERIIGNALQIRNMLDVIRRTAATDSTILIQGESGTGKELVAHAVHHGSLRRSGPFIAVNCGSFTETLLESELFGHVKGSFTGATSDRKGLLEVAGGGTMFLDEVGDMSLQTQIKLLRVLETREVRPVGGTATKHIDIRFVAATNTNLAERIAARRFREDLYYRLNVIPIEVPPLRDRSGDIPLLAGHFLRTYAEKMGKKVLGFDEDAMSALVSYRWPGNVRELENAVERAVALMDGETVSVRDLEGTPVAGALSRHLQPSSLSSARSLATIPPDGVNLDNELENVERAFVLNALEASGWNLTKAADLLSTSFRSLRYRVKKLGISKPEKERDGGKE